MFSTSTILKTLEASFPFASMREEQKEAFKSLAPWLEKLFKNKFESRQYFGIDAPCGTGKSLIAITLALAIQDLLKKTDWESQQIWIVTANKLLQDQYQRDFSELVYDLRGLDNYPCDHDYGKSCGTSRCARQSAPNKMQFTPPEYCARDCGYDKAKDAAKYKPILLLNVAKAFQMLNQPGQYRTPLLLIFDEGHNVESALDNEAGISISPQDLERIGQRFEKYFPVLNDLERIKKGLKMLSASIGPDLSEQLRFPADKRDIPMIKKMESLLKKYEVFSKYEEAGIEFVQCSNEKLDLKPSKVHLIFKEVFQFPTVFLSATLLSKTGFKSITGLTDPQLTWFGVDSPFPKENRPIINYWRLGARPLNYSNLKEELDNVLERIRGVMDLHSKERGIIHTHTYAIANAVYERLGSQYGRRLLYPKTAGEQRVALEEHKRKSNSVLISPSMTEGVDLMGDLARFTVMCKVPYLPTNDPVVAARMDADSNWYSYRTAMTVVQAPGRGVRSKEDWCKTYLVDPAFQGFINRSRELFPEWFLSSLDRRNVGPI
jgi:Rad3-related DNA helicase